MLGLTLLSIWLLSAVVVVAAIWRAPKGWEDRNGFHRGERNSAPTPPSAGVGGGRVPDRKGPAADNFPNHHAAKVPETARLIHRQNMSESE